MPDPKDLVLSGAAAIFDAFDSYRTQFRIITRRAQMRFENRDWRGMQADAMERLELYQQTAAPAASAISGLLGPTSREKETWAGMKAAYSERIAHRRDRELAETFFNSVTRRTFTTVGVDAQVEFVDSDFVNPPPTAESAVFQLYPGNSDPVSLFDRILADFPFRAGYTNRRGDAERVARQVRQRVPGAVESVEMIRSAFFRGKGAYLIGRMSIDGHKTPLALCLLHTTWGIGVDAVLLTEDEISILFSFTRSYFHLQIDHPFELVQFLKKIMPRKPLSELYTSVGFNKHGKTELYRELLHHLAATEDRFEIAPGARGMVMTVFTLPSFEVVFKIIKDRFDEPKKTSRREVMEKYRLVFEHDRAGRLVDAQEFEFLKFDRSRFSPALLEELQRTALETVSVEETHVVIRHLYTERRVTPLDVYLQHAGPEATHAAVMDYGNAIKDLARANIFTGDVLSKNFGVTRHGRVVSYDYDELCLLTDCNFRTLPVARNEEEELSGEPWFYVSENDYFPEEFESFFGLTGPRREAFRERHADLFRVEFWRQIQERIRSGELIHIFPYPETLRLSS